MLLQPGEGESSSREEAGEDAAVRKGIEERCSREDEGSQNTVHAIKHNAGRRIMRVAPRTAASQRKTGIW